MIIKVINNKGDLLTTKNWEDPIPNIGDFIRYENSKDNQIWINIISERIFDFKLNCIWIKVDTLYNTDI